jgi:hypothetical protein
LFGQNDHHPEFHLYCRWPEADRLKEVAAEISSARAAIGEANEICGRFLELCSLRGANVPGEPRLAAQLLAEIGNGPRSG